MDYKEFLEDYKETLSKYCYAAGDFPIRKNEEGEYFVDAELTDCMYVMGGHFDIEYVIDEIKAGDFPFLPRPLSKLIRPLGTNNLPPPYNIMESCSSNKFNRKQNINIILCFLICFPCFS